MSLHWWALLGAGLLEVAWAAGFKFAFRDNHTITTATLAAMAASFWLLSVAMRTLPVGTAYAIWTGIGAIGAAVVGIVFLKEPATALRIASIAAIVGGVIGLKLSAPA
ncbi:MAG: multidrug efflux SMR transporter [Hyphomonadaceae bacterium]|nr:multidrug efflux SMR transporter [Hyphomonadaceae bacterium]